MDRTRTNLLTVYVYLGTVFVLLFTFAAAMAQQTDSRKEIWPEVDIFVPLEPRFRLVLITSLTKVEETRDNTEGSVQAGVDYIPHKKASFRLAYRYGFSLTGENPYKEHRILFEQTFRHLFPLEILVSDRNREEIRVVNGKTSGRYRNRLMMEREFHFGRFTLTPYGSGELYYDNRFDVWNRNRLTAGVQIPLKRGFPLISLLDPKRQIVFETYYTHQNDSRSSPAHLNAIGFTVNIYF